MSPNGEALLTGTGRAAEPLNGVTMPFLSTLTVGLVSGTLPTTEIQNTGPIVDSFELQRLQTEFPGVGTWNAPDGRLNRIFGRPMETGSSPRETAMNVVRKWSGIWGLTLRT